jgi:glycosyltransferase involved in cell wall biosynthesis
VISRSAAIAARGHDVRLVTLGPVLEARGIEVTTRPIPSGVAESIAAARGFLRDIRDFHPDLLHLHYAGGKLGTLATLSAVRPLVVTVMGGDVLPEQHAAALSPLERRGTRRILEEADLILAKSDFLRSAVAALGDFAGKVETVRWGVDPAEFRPDRAGAEALRARLGLPAGTRVLLSPRPLQPLYNVHLIVEALPAVLARVPEALLLVTDYNGLPAYRAQVEAAIARLKLGGRVRLLPRTEHSAMPALYSLAAAVISVPSSDGLPQTLFEAMACEVPVVLGSLPGYREVVTDGESAVLVQLDASSIAAGIVRVLTDADFATRLTRAAAARVRDRALLPRDAERVEALYRELLTRRRRHPPIAGRVLDAIGLLAR